MERSTSCDGLLPALLALLAVFPVAASGQSPVGSWAPLPDSLHAREGSEGPGPTLLLPSTAVAELLGTGWSHGRPEAAVGIPPRDEAHGSSLGRNVAMGAISGFLVGAIASWIALHSDREILADPRLVIVSDGVLGAAAGTLVALVWTTVQQSGG